jgi:hypothetical protein
VLNTVANYIKKGAIIATDAVNAVYDPFEEFTRVGVHLETTYLASAFEIHMRDKFLDSSTGIWQYELPWNSGDQCIWHGVTTAMWAIKSTLVDEYDPVLYDSVKAMRHFFEFPDVIRRGVVGGEPQYNVSSDQISGLLCGLYWAYTYGRIDAKVEAKKFIQQLADTCLRTNFKLVNPGGTETKHGKLVNGLLTDPLNLCIALAILKLADLCYPEREYKVFYSNLVEQFKPTIPYGKVRLLWRDNAYDSHRAAISYSILCDLEKDEEIHGLYEKGLKRVWDIERKTGNPWIYYLLRRATYYRPEDIDQVKKHLTEFTLSDKIMRVEKINSPLVATAKWGSKLRSLQPIPRYKMGSQDFFWQRNMRSVDDWVGQKEPVEAYNGMDYLIAYYGLKSLRLI